MAADDAILGELVAEDVDAANSELGSFGYVVEEVYEAGLVRQIDGSKAYLSLDVSAASISFENAQPVSPGNAGVNGDIAGANLQAFEQVATREIVIALETYLADLVERSFADEENNGDPLQVGREIQAFADTGVEISFFAEVLGQLGDVGVELLAVQITGGKDEGVGFGGDLRAQLGGRYPVIALESDFANADSGALDYAIDKLSLRGYEAAVGGYPYAIISSFAIVGDQGVAPTSQQIRIGKVVSPQEEELVQFIIGETSISGELNRADKGLLEDVKGKDQGVRGGRCANFNVLNAAELLNALNVLVDGLFLVGLSGLGADFGENG